MASATHDVPPGTRERPVAPADRWGSAREGRDLAMVFRRALGRAVRVAAALFVLGAIVAGPVAAAVPKVSGPITDETGRVTASMRSDGEAAIQKLVDATGVQLFAVFVDSTGGPTISDFVDQVRQQNSFGPGDGLLAVALGDRTYQLYLDLSLGLTSSDVEAIATSDVEPYLRSGDYGRAIAGAADGIRTALAGLKASPAPVTPGASPAPSTPSSESSLAIGSLVGLILGVVLLVIGFLVVLRVLAHGRLTGRSPEERDISTGDLAREANRLLVATDDGIRDSDQELGFAEAQFGSDEVAPFRAALDASKTDLKAAFSARQQLDDDRPDDAATRRRLLTEIVERCRSAQARLTEQSKHFEELRAIERHAPDIVRGLPDAIAPLEARLPEAREARSGLEAYAPASWAAVAGNVTEAEKRLAFARQAADAGTAAIAGGDSATVAKAARTGQAALAQATSLLDAIDRLAASAAQAAQQAPVELAAAEKDVEGARSSLGGTAPDQATSAKLSQAASLIAAAQASLAAPKPDVLGALHGAVQANALGDEIVAAIRGEQERQARAKAALDGAIQAAQVAVGRASDFIASRRHGVRQQARTRLAEAQRHLEAANGLAPTDAASATNEARYAERMANEAYALASDDFDQWDSGGFGGRRRGPEGELAGVILGGIIGGMLGAGRGGFGGTPWGGMGGGPFGGGFGGGGFGGGFGGGGARGGGGFGGFGGGGARGGGRF